MTGTYSAKSETCHRQNECLCRLDSETLVIELEGKLIHKNSRGTSIEATQNGSVLQVTFNEDLGEVTIIIENISGADEQRKDCSIVRGNDYSDHDIP